MATSLSWKSHIAYKKTYGKILYCHPIHVDLQLKQYVHEKAKLPKFLCFYIGSFNVFLAGLFSLANTLIYFFNLKKMPIFLVFRFLIMVAFSGLCSSLNTLCVGVFYDGLVKYLNMLISFDKRIQSLRLFTPVNFRKRNDITGLVMIIIVITLFLVGILMGPGSIIRKSDPGYHFLLFYFPSYVNLKLTKVLRYLHYQWYLLEACRSIICILLLLILMFKIYIASLNTIKELTNSGANRRHTAIKVYAQLHIINQTGFQVVHMTSTVLMLFGYWLCSLGLWLIVAGRKLFPLSFYILLSVIVVVVFIATICLLPVAINVFECSETLISRFWRTRETRKLISEGTEFERNYWEKLVRSQRPLRFCYGPGFFDRDTLPNFIYQVVNNTVTMIIISGT